MAIENLKIINDMHKSGSIVELLRRVRSNRNQLEDFYKKVNTQLGDIKQQKEKDSLVKEKVEEKVSIKVQPEEPVVQPAPKAAKIPEPVAVPEFRPVQNNVPVQNSNQQKQNNNNYRNFNDRPPQQQRFNNNNAQGGQRPYNPNYNNGQGGQRPYNPNYSGGQGGQRPFNPNYNNGQGGQRPYNPNYNNGQGGQRPYNPNYNNGQGGQRPFNPNYNNGQGGQRPYNPNFNRTQGAPGTNNGAKFVSTRANNFRSFKDVPTESSSVLAQPERNYGNKNKSRVYSGEERKQTRRSFDNDRNGNVLLEGDYGFEEVRMGSRKLIKGKKKEDIFVAPKVESAVITTENISVKTLSEKIGKTATEIIKQLMILGVMAKINDNIDFQTAELVASELGIKLEQKLEKSFETQLVEISSDKTEEKPVKRPPVVTVMGHVDHGKTSLLDALRKTNVALGEAGGITQSIGAYQITVGHEKITFIDTPGHAAFTAMRARGAKSTDIAILVVAADDGIMPQTVEAIKHIKEANVPMIVAINKMDKSAANPERIKQQLAEHDVLPEEWGGNAIIVPISAKVGTGLDELVKTILLVAEVEDLKATKKTMAIGVIIEAELDKNKGPVASVLVQSGTLRVGDNIVSGLTFGKVKAMFDENGKKLHEATPSTPAVVLGFNEVPSAGDQVFAVDEKFSKQVIGERKDKIKETRSNKTSGVSLDDFMNKVNEGKMKTLNVILKADTQGGVEALSSTLETVKNEEVKIRIVSAGAGAVTESDVVLANASGSMIICFNQKASPKAKALAEQNKVQIKEYKIIYKIIEEITELIDGMLTVKYEEQVIGHGEIRMAFKLSSYGMVAGSYITDGYVTRQSFVRVTRGEETLGTSAIESLRVVKDEKSEVNKGFECGIRMKENISFKEGDNLEFYINVPVRRKK